MKRRLLFLVMLIGGVRAARRHMPDGWREGVSRMPGVMMGRMLEHMPDE